MAKNDPFPNEWEEVSNIDESDFFTPPFNEVLEDSVAWYLPDPYYCIVRSFNRKGLKMREYAYKRETVARNKIKELAALGYEITILTQGYVGILNYRIND